VPKKKYRPAELLRDHARPRSCPEPVDAVIETRLTELVAPATYALTGEYRRRGLRGRVLTLPVMVSLLIALVWRRIPAVTELARVLTREGALWTPPTPVSQQALNLRLRVLPPALVRQVVLAVLPQVAARAAARSRPSPPIVNQVRAHFPRIWAADATTLEALFTKVGLLQGIPTTVLGGTLLGLLDVATRLPVNLLWDASSTSNERPLLDRLLPTVEAGTLLVLDTGFFGFARFDWLTEHGIAFIIPDRPNTAGEQTRLLSTSERHEDALIRVGLYDSNPCRHPLRRVEILVGTTRRVYVTNVLDPAVLSAADVVEVYRQRWRIEEAFLLTKRLLGLSYLWTGAANGIQSQIWATWLLYALLVDLADDVAQVRNLPLARISLEMVFRGLYHFTMAHARGETDDPVAYLATQQDLGIAKAPRPPSAVAQVVAALRSDLSPPLTRPAHTLT